MAPGASTEPCLSLALTITTSPLPCANAGRPSMLVWPSTAGPYAREEFAPVGAYELTCLCLLNELNQGTDLSYRIYISIVFHIARSGGHATGHGTWCCFLFCQANAVGRDLVHQSNPSPVQNQMISTASKQKRKVRLRRADMMLCRIYR
ncbi:hypothetical protein I7I51_00821 [Histoplasma capsulatum]|uniref:Uncharacterized protein n=1 Tax=Ajellomyces capsulatus TaxID=5037 RepID=A0A8A1MCV6_AJECA|nr:hypothetical protein I7I51_00821 [Histoplasma capsulatum]